MFVSLRLSPPFLTPSLFLQLQLCVGSDSVASLFYNACLLLSWRRVHGGKMCDGEALFVPPLLLRYFPL